MTDRNHLNKFNLKFNGKWRFLEDDYDKFYSLESLKRNRLAIFLSWIFYMFFGLLDFFLLPEYFRVFCIIRYLIITPFCILVLILTYFPFFKKISYAVISLLIITGGMGIIAMIGLAQVPMAHTYYAGIILILVYANLFYQLPFFWNLASSLIISVAYEFVLLFYTNTSLPYIIGNNFFYISFLIISLVACYLDEMKLREHFFQQYLLNQEKEKVINQKLKMEELGTLSGGIAHDFNNILMAIMGYTELALEETQQKSSLHYYQTEVLNVVLRAKSMTQQILSFSRKNNEEQSIFSLDHIINEVLNLMKSTIPANIKIHKNLNGRSSIVANSTQIHRVLINLITNSIQAMNRGGGDITLQTEVKDWNDIPFYQRESLKPMTYVLLTFSDTGPGIEKANIEKIFTPYFTTKKENVGTGLGLSVVKEIITELGGNIFVESIIDRGAQFFVYLPLQED